MAAIAFIGLGQMGSPMASNLLQQGHQLRVFDVNAEAVRHLVDKGATPAANPAQAAKDAEFIITGNDSNLLIVFYVQIMPDDFVMQLHRF